MLFDKIKPEAAGVKSAAVIRYINLLERRQIPMHSLLMMKGDQLFCECYWAPFHKDFNHRMYSQTKSYVSIAIGLLEEEGKLSLDDKIIDHFPEKRYTAPEAHLARQTIRDMLTMSTAGTSIAWFRSDYTDRTELYLNEPKIDPRPSASLWEYDSAGSQVLSNLVEKLSGMTLFDYLNEKIFRKLGTFKTATMLKTRNGDSWGDSSLLCTSRDMLSFARFVMNYGVWNGERLMNEKYLREATSKVTDNHEACRHYAFHHGYGYQIWRTERNGFAFVGMGNQLTVCLPDDDIIFTCTADCQGDDGTSREFIINHFFELIMDEIQKAPLPENPEEAAKLESLGKELKLFAVKGMEDSPFRVELNGATYVCGKNPMGITEFTFRFRDASLGELHYTNAQGKKILPFRVNGNAFGKFPQLGYSNDVGGMRTTDGFLYDDAVSMAWLSENNLILYVQIIDRYFGTGTMIFAFRGDEAFVRMTKCAEDFLDEYTGNALAKRITKG